MSGEPGGLWKSGLWAALAAVVMVVWVVVRNADEDRPAIDAPFRALRGVASEEEQTRLSRLLEESYGVLRSPQFAANLQALAGRYPAAYASGGQPKMPLDEVARTITLDRFGSRFVPVDVAVLDTPDMDNPNTVLGVAGPGPGAGRYSDMALSRAVVDAFAAADVVMRSCAINIAAHEYSHTLSATPLGFQNAFTDTTGGETRIRRRERDRPVASYLIGTVAQCTWLQQQGRVSRDGLAACVEVFGVTSGNSQRCDEFAEGQAVAPRPGLAPASPPL